MIKPKMKRLNALTLAEVMIVLAIIAVVTVFLIRIVKSKLDFVTQMQYYATINNLKNGAYDLITDGYKDSDGNLQKVLPEKGNESTNKTGFCNRLADLYNTEGTVDCTQTVSDGTTDFSALTPSFTLSNGSLFYNVGHDALNVTPSTPSGDNSTLNTDTEKDNLLNFRSSSQIEISGAESFFMQEHMEALCSYASNSSCTNIDQSQLSMNTTATAQWPTSYNNFKNDVQQALNAIENYMKAVITDAIKAAGLSYTVNNVNYVYQQIFNNSTLTADANTLNSYFDKSTVGADWYRYYSDNCKELARDDQSRCLSEPVMDKPETDRCNADYDSSTASCKDGADGAQVDRDSFWASATTHLSGTYKSDIIAAATAYFSSMPDKGGGGITAVNGYFDIFVDVNGNSKGKTKLDNDVFEFYVTRSGAVYPAKASAAADNKSLAKARIYYKAHVGDTYSTILKSNLTFRQAFCESNTVEQQLIDKFDYCSGYSPDTTNCPASGNTCKVILTRPGY